MTDPSLTPLEIGRYRVEAPLATGGMATVHLGRALDRPDDVVAIKRLHPHLARDPDLVMALLEEARLTTAIRHENVVETLDVVATDGELFLVMPYVHGDTLARLLMACRTQKTSCPTTIAARILHDVLLGLHAAHETTDKAGKPLSIIHRDVSPQNILVTDGGVARLLDFGVAKAAGQTSTTREGHLKGKVPYMAPELLSFESPTRQVDVWGAAVVLWELLCARRLFVGDQEVAVWGRVLESEIVPPSRVTGDPTLDAVVMRGLERNREARFRTALEMAQAIEAASPLAPRAEVATWVRTLAERELAERARLIAALPRATPGRRRSRPLVVAGAGALVAAIGATIVLANAPVAVRRDVPTTPPIASSSFAATSAPAPTPSTPMDVATTAASVVAPPAPSSARASAARPRPASKPAPSRVDSCDPPYTLDEGGRKVWKRHCPL